MCKLFSLVTLISIILVGCQANVTIPPTLGTTGDDLKLREMLVYPEELGWPDANYSIGGSRPNDYIHPDFPQINVIKIESRPFSNSTRHIDPRMMAQDIYVYESASTAKEVYDIGSGYFRISQTTKPSTIILENILAGCTTDPENRSNLICNVGMGHGIYYVHGFMYIDNDQITLEHWDNYMNLMQEKLVERVESDSSS
jgi:hypothetical protein